MEREIEAAVLAAWARASGALVERVADAARRADDLLRLDEHNREGHKSERLARSMRGFGDGALDAGALARVLGETDAQRLMEPGRFERIRKARAELGALLRAWHASPPAAALAPFSRGAGKLLEAAEAHLDALAPAFALDRIVRLEEKAAYCPKTHDAFFASFGWDKLEDAEVRLCPPFVAVARASELDENGLAGLLRLCTSGRPVKIVLLRPGPGRREGGTGRSAAYRCALEPEMLPLALRGVYVLQTTPADPAFEPRLASALASPRPTVVSLLVPEPGREEGFAERAERARASRAHPDLVYDPDRSAEFLECFDLAGNPAPERDWPAVRLAYRSEKGEELSVERPYTFADFAAEDPGFATELIPLPADLDGRQPVRLAEYLALSSEQRGGKVPYVQGTDAKGRLGRFLPSHALTVQAAERLRLWRSLRAFAGVASPHVRAAERRVTERLRAEHDDAVTRLKAELDAKVLARQREAVGGAMRRLAEKLTGVSLAGRTAPLAEALLASPASAGANAPAAPAKGPEAAAPAPQPAAAPAAVSDEAWIETKRCTACDECTTINKRIFAYNEDKQAVVKDPKGGPFKDIVKAAEKCSARIIHPGKPHDPAEKDLDKWINRAEPFQ